MHYFKVRNKASIVCLHHCIKPIFSRGLCNQVLEASLKNPEALRLASRHFKAHDIRSQDMQQFRLKHVGLVEHDRQSEAIIVNHSSTSSDTHHDELFVFSHPYHERSLRSCMCSCVSCHRVIVLVHSISNTDS